MPLTEGTQGGQAQTSTTIDRPRAKMGDPGQNVDGYIGEGEKRVQGTRLRNQTLRPTLPRVADDDL